jgi:hypothetical protein
MSIDRTVGTFGIALCLGGAAVSTAATPPATDQGPQARTAPGPAAAIQFDLKAIERPRILRQAAEYLNEPPVTVTATRCPRSAGGPNDFYSEGDYWWPDPANPKGPYIQRDGLSNPDNFSAHRHAMVRLSDIIGTLASAYILTGDEQYAAQAARHLEAWFVEPKTRMNPNLLYGQAIFGHSTGRSIGVIDTLHLIEVARGTSILRRSPKMQTLFPAVQHWFADYLQWMNTHPYGTGERDARNNHGTCWVVQAAAFAQLTANAEVSAYCSRRFKEVLLPNQMDRNGSFPAELQRTKPYGYSIFNLDALTTIAQILSTPQDDLWAFTTADGRGLKLATDFLYPYLADKTKWPFPKDVMYWDEWPVRQPSLIFAGLAYHDQRYLDLWQKLAADPTNDEVRRNVPIRHPLIWLREASPAP